MVICATGVYLSSLSYLAAKTIKWPWPIDGPFLCLVGTARRANSSALVVSAKASDAENFVIQRDVSIERDRCAACCELGS